jgi:hypothetical protein
MKKCDKLCHMNSCKRLDPYQMAKRTGAISEKSFLSGASHITALE